MTDDQLNEDFDRDEAPVHTEEPPQYGVGPFSIREVALVGVWVVAFVVSFFSINEGRFDSVWTSSLLWVLAIAVPTVAVFLIVLRRLSPDGIRRVGSLGIDQFASVAFSVAAVVWLQLVWETVSFAIETGAWLRTWVIWVELVLMLAGVVLTVLGPLIPPFEQDFRGRAEVPAHRNARPIRPVSPRPAAAPRTNESETSDFAAYAPPAGAAPELSDARRADAQPETSTVTTAWEPAHSRDTFEPVETPSTTVEPVQADQPVDEAPARQQAFWALVPEERDVVDEIGIPVFRIGPSAWALVIEDRGEAFVVRHEDGRVGYLHDVSGVTRG
ncbi:hypothetical protein [Microbacterium sp. CFBP9034]|uniref:hypothetical protein n=1 Tax=Microbacterium sp. CFBP9034 TaxID=3096540 RepID=UPI002A6B48B0|nr:hypothetical protein [Microbacterium sp. CFBP9034]MDY0909975.1 hypothetical protein [Microbacterium sp. CFBP9034]